MGTILRVGFAMGGGVSLGTFSGGALSQALKLLIVYGQDVNGKQFDKVEVDVFSGASAGALSLAGMLRHLIKRPTEWTGKEAEEILEKQLQEEFGTAWTQLQLEPEKKKDLVAAHIVQLMQEKLWSKEIELGPMLEENIVAGEGLSNKASILNRGAIERIAKKYLVNWENGCSFEEKRILADRVLYACTLANLTPIISDATPEITGPQQGYVGLNDGMRSHSHRDMRVFDLNFKEVDKVRDDASDRWCRYHNGEEYKGEIGDLRLPRTWAKISATAIASGCFPFAFEPVVLRRKAYEYGKQLWSKTFGTKQDKYDKSSSFPFTYVDGGMFNNEPIREAFRMASYIDGLNPPEPGQQIQRLIVFVDPFVSEATPAFSVPVHRLWQMVKPVISGSVDGYGLVQKASIDRLLGGHLINLLSAITDEGRVIEADKIFQVRNTFQLRKDIRIQLNHLLKKDVDAGELSTLYYFCKARLESSQMYELIPSGPLNIVSELERVIREEDKTLGAILGMADSWCNNNGWNQDVDANLWLRALVFLSIDLILGIEGKMEGSKLIAIAPFINLKNPKPEPIYLPGGALAGFAGFMSNVPDALEYKAAKRCSMEFLQACDVIPQDLPGFVFPDDNALRDYNREQYNNDVGLGIKRLRQRLEDMVLSSHIIQIFPGVDAIIRRFISAYVDNVLKTLEWKEKERYECEFYIIVPDEHYELDGYGITDIDSGSVKDPVTGKLTLITYATCEIDEAKNVTWTGGFAKDGKLDIDMDGDIFHLDEDFCEILLPTLELIYQARMQPQMRFSYELRPDIDKGRNNENALSASCWKVDPGLIPLDESLLGD